MTSAPRTTVEPTARGHVLAVLGAASLLGAWLSGDPHVHLAAAILCAPLLLDWLCKPRGLGRVRIDAMPRRTTVGAPFRDLIALQHDGRRTLRELQLLEPQLRARPAFVDSLPGGARGQVPLACQSHERGHLRERTFVLRTEWPLGLFRARATLIAPTDLVTEPARAPLDDRLLLATGDREPAADTHTQLDGDDFHALREHTYGEDARAVHARRSAALGHLVRTVRRGRAPRVVTLVIDLRRRAGAARGGHRRFELGLGIAATVLDRLRERGATARVLLLGDAIERREVGDHQALRELLTRLAEVESAAPRAPEPALLAELQAADACYWIGTTGARPPFDPAALPQVRWLGGDA